MRRAPLFSPEWFRNAAAVLSAPVDEDNVIRFRLNVTDGTNSDVRHRAAVLLDRATDGLRCAPWTSSERPNLEITLNLRQATVLLFGNAAERARLLEDEGIQLVGVFQYLYYIDRALQQDQSNSHSRLRNLTSGIPDDVGRPCWPEPGSGPPLSRHVDAVQNIEEMLPRTMAALRNEIPESSPGAQLYVSHDASGLTSSAALGECRPGVPFHRDALVTWNCCAKLLGAVAVGQLWEQGRLDPDAPVAEFVPWFSGEGRETVTARQLLTHSTTLPPAFDPFHGRLVVDRAGRQKHLSMLRLPTDERPGTRHNYGAKWAWFLLAEVVQAVDGRDYDTYVADEVLKPCGMLLGRSYHSPEEYRRIGDRLPLRYISGDGKPAQPSYWFSTEGVCTTSLPGASHRGPMSDLGLLLNMLLHGGEASGGRVLRPQTVAALTGHQRVGVTDRFGNADWGLGVRVESRYLGELYTSFSRYASHRSFGHYGLWTSVGFADPEAGGLVVALHFNGQTWHEQHMARMFRVNDAVYEDLGLAI